MARMNEVTFLIAQLTTRFNRIVYAFNIICYVTLNKNMHPFVQTLFILHHPSNLLK